MDKRSLSEAEFDDRIKDWSQGKPVRVIASSREDLKCLARITFRLADRGVRLIQFTDPAAPSGRKPE